MKPAEHRSGGGGSSSDTQGQATNVSITDEHSEIKTPKEVLVSLTSEIAFDRLRSPPAASTLANNESQNVISSNNNRPSSSINGPTDHLLFNGNVLSNSLSSSNSNLCTSESPPSTQSILTNLTSSSLSSFSSAATTATTVAVSGAKDNNDARCSPAFLSSSNNANDDCVIERIQINSPSLATQRTRPGSRPNSRTSAVEGQLSAPVRSSSTNSSSAILPAEPVRTKQHSSDRSFNASVALLASQASSALQPHMLTTSTSSISQHQQSLLNAFLPPPPSAIGPPPLFEPVFAANSTYLSHIKSYIFKKVFLIIYLPNNFWINSIGIRLLNALTCFL